MKLVATAILLFLIVSCGMAQKQGVEIFSIQTDSLFDDNNQLTSAGNALVEKIAAKMNSDSNSCLQIKQSCIHESDTICYQKLKTFVNTLAMQVPAGHISVIASEPVHLNCEDCFEFIISECPELSKPQGNHIQIIVDD